MKMKKATITLQDKDGNIIVEVPLSQANEDWIRAARLARKAREGDQEAAEKLKRMQDTQMYIVDDEEE